jgi:protein OS-9
MTTTDVIYLVKEMAICQYVLIIHSPHLCGLPGFRAPHAYVQPAGIRCRQVIADEEFEGWATRLKEEGNGGVGDAGPLGLPWQLTRPVGGREGVEVEMQAAEQGGAHGQDSAEHAPLDGHGADDSLEYEMDDLDLQQFLLDALGEYDAREGAGEGGSEEFMLLSLEEDDEGNFVLDTDLLGSHGGRKVKAVEGDERELLVKAIKRFLENKPEAKRDHAGGEDATEPEERDDSEGSASGRHRDEL